MSIQNWKFKTTENGNFFWEALTESSEIQGRSSQNFKSQNGAKYNADLLGRSGSFSQKLVWEFSQDKESNWLWKADNTVNKENVAAAHEPFKSKIEAAQNAMLFGYKGELTSLVNPMTTGASGNKKKILDPNQSANNINSQKNQKEKENLVQPIIAQSQHVKIKEYIEDSGNERIIINNKNEEDYISAWWKWLLLALIILGLLYWLIPMLTKKTDTLQNSNISISSVLASQSVTRLTSIQDVLQSSDFTMLSGAIKSSNLVDTINKSTPLTLLAPTNSAFQSVSAETLSNLQKPENIGELQNLLKNHLFGGNINLGDLKDGSTIKSLANIELPVKIDNNKLFIDGVEIDKTAKNNSNGFNVYAVPNILPIPVSPNISSASSNIIDANSNKIDDYKAENSLDILSKNGNYKILLTAINSTNLKDILESNGPITIFAPNDEAMKSIQTDDLFKLENKTKLQSFIKNHIALGKYTFDDFKLNKIITNLNDQKVILRISEDGIGKVEGFKNTSSAPIPDIITNNGIIHTLTDTPLLI